MSKSISFIIEENIVTQKLLERGKTLIHSNYNQDLFDDWKRHSGISDLLSVIEDLKNEDVHFKIPKISYLEDSSNPVTDLYSIEANPIFLYYNLVKKEFFLKYKFAFKNTIVLDEPEEFVVGETIKLLEITHRRTFSKKISPSLQQSPERLTSLKLLQLGDFIFWILMKKRKALYSIQKKIQNFTLIVSWI